MVEEVKRGKLCHKMSPIDNKKSKTISLPWIPGVSPKLRKAYREAGYKVVFKSGKNLENILTSKNKSKLPINSYPGIYKIPCSCGITPYRGETKKKICTRIEEHKKYIQKEQWEKSGVASHARSCAGNVNFDGTKTVKIENNAFNRKIRETLEIQRHDCHYTNGGMNIDKGRYVKTSFWMPFFRHLNNCEKRRSGKSENNEVNAVLTSVI